MNFHRTAQLIAVLCFAMPALLAAQTLPDNPGEKMAREYLRLARENLPQSQDDMLAAIGLDDVCQALANLGDVAEARDIAGKLHSFRIAAFVKIAKSQTSHGDAAGAKKTLRDALPAAGTTSDPADLADLGVAMADAGDVDGARELAGQMQASSRQAGVLVSVGVVQARVGNLAAAKQSFAAAKDTLKRSTDDFPRLRLIEIARSQIEAGDFDGAEGTVQELTDAEQRALGFTMLGEALAKKGDKDAARSAVAAARKSLAGTSDADGRMKGMVVLRLDSLLAQLDGSVAPNPREQAGKAFAEARKSAEAIDIQSEWRPETLTAISLEQRAAGDAAAAADTMKAALIAADQIANSGNRTHAFWEIAASQAGAGDIAAAKETLVQAMRGRMDSSETAMVAGQVAGGLARAGAAEADFQWIKDLPTPEERGLAYAAAAAGLTERAGQK